MTVQLLNQLNVCLLVYPRVAAMPSSSHFSTKYRSSILKIYPARVATRVLRKSLEIPIDSHTPFAKQPLPPNFSNPQSPLFLYDARVCSVCVHQVNPFLSHLTRGLSALYVHLRIHAPYITRALSCIMNVFLLAARVFDFLSPRSRACACLYTRLIHLSLSRPAGEANRFLGLYCAFKSGDFLRPGDVSVCVRERARTRA